MSREMKDSGIEWVKRVPNDWDIIKGKHLLNLMARPVRKSDEVITCFRDGEVVLRSERRVDGFTMSDKEIGYQGINKGDIVIHGMDGFAGAMGVSKSTGKGSPVLIVCNPKEDDCPRYIIYYLRSLAMTNVFLALATGIRERSCDLRWNKIAVLPFLRPSFSEQQKIADYLDKVCGEIDDMIALQEKMIEELKAYKQSVITEAVTKGLNPNVPMRDSGIDWIGEIPEHWAIRRLKFICDIQTGNQDTQDAIQDGEYPFYVRSPKVEHSIKYSFEGEGILMAGDGAGAGRVFHHAFGKYAVHQRVYRLSSFKDINTYYLFHYISNLFCKVMDMGSAQSTVPSVRLPMLLNFMVCMPPLSEQQEIADILDKKCSDIDALIAIKQKKIEALKDYKKSLIYEYVTGKKQVN